MRGSAGEYVASVDWASFAACKRWLESGENSARAAAATTIFECRRGNAAAAAVERAAAATVAADALVAAGMDPRAVFAFAAGESLEGVNEEDELSLAGGDTSFLHDSRWAKWSKPSRAAPDAAPMMNAAEFAAAKAAKAAKAAPAVTTAASVVAGKVVTYPSGSSGEDPEYEEGDEVANMGGDPTFLDASLWRTSPAPASTSSNVLFSDDTWDGLENDSAHLD